MEVASFGKLLVKELELEPSTNTLGRWMAHYLADIIKKAEAARGIEKSNLEKECFDLILKFWDHRTALPGHKPLESFESILKTLAYLSGEDHSSGWYFRSQEFQNEKGEIAQWLKIALSIDHSATSLIRWCIAMASLKAGEKEGKWLDAVIPKLFRNNADFHLASLLMNNAEVLAVTKRKKN
jgi:hypothetical protein